jgi:hypothetical protein
MKHFLGALILLNVSIAFEAWAQSQEAQQPAPAPTAEQQPVATASAEEAAAGSKVVAQLPPSPMAQQPTSPIATPPPAPTAPSTLKVGSLSIAPYGFFLITAHWNGSGFGPTPFNHPEAGITRENTGASTRYDYPTFANGLPGGFIMTVRQSRFGAKLDLPTDIGTTLKGRIEFDLMAGFLDGGNSSSWFVPMPRFRLGFISGGWKLGQTASIGFVAGQDFGLFAPLGPVSLGLINGPVYGYAGNPGGIRSPQFRVEGDVGTDLSLGWGLGVLTPASNISDSVSPQLIRPDFGPGNFSRRPNFEARLALSYKQEKKNVLQLGISGHRGWERYELREGRKTVDGGGLAADLQAEYWILGVRGEVFKGSNMDCVLGNFGNEGVRLLEASATSLPSSVVPIHTQGAWGQLVVKPIALLQVFGGLGVEDPDNVDLGAREEAPSPTIKTHNRQLHAGVIVTPTKVWQLGAEYVKTTTRYMGKLPRADASVLSGDHIALSTSLTF